MRALKLAALLGLGTLWLPWAKAEPSDDLAGTPGAMSEGGSDTNDRDYLNSLDIVDDSLKPKLELVRIGAQRGTNNLLGVFLGLSNKTEHRLELEVETVYKDKAGNELNTGSWIHFTLAPHGELDYRSSSISEAADDFLIRVRRVRGE